MLTPFKDLLAEALRHQYAVGYFEAWDVYSLEAVVEAAEEEKLPVILGFGGAMMEPNWLDGGAIERLGALGLATARAAHVPAALLLNEVKTFAQAIRGILSGYNAVMLDTSELSFAENIALTQKLAEVAHAAGVGVEAELGVLPDASASPGAQQSQLTDPQQAALFVKETGVDALAVSIGNVHILTHGETTIDYARLAAIRAAVDVPLVLHGGTGLPESAIPRILSLGVAKVNIGTALKQAYLNGIREALRKVPEDASIQEIMGSRKESDVLQQGKVYIRGEVRRRLRLWQPA